MGVQRISQKRENILKYQVENLKLKTTVPNNFKLSGDIGNRIETTVELLNLKIGQLKSSNLNEKEEKEIQNERKLRELSGCTERSNFYAIKVPERQEEIMHCGKN